MTRFSHSFLSTDFNLNPAVFLVDAKFTKLFLHGLLKSVKAPDNAEGEKKHCFVVVLHADTVLMR